MEIIRRWVNVNDRHLKDFGNLLFDYYELHVEHDGKIFSKCLNTWNCDCDFVSYENTRRK